MINVAQSELTFIFVGGAKETTSGMSSMEVIQSRKSRDLSSQNTQGFVEENQDTGLSFEKDGVHSINGSSRPGLTKKHSSAYRIKRKVKQTEDTKTDLWWLNLRYVFVSTRNFCNKYITHYFSYFLTLNFVVAYLHDEVCYCYRTLLSFITLYKNLGMEQIVFNILFMLQCCTL